MHIGIWHWSKKPFNGETVRTEPTGGTETAIAYTCEALAGKNNRISVYCNTEKEVRTEGVDYIPADHFENIASQHEFDAFIIVRHLAACMVPVRTKALCYWAHDNTNQPFMHGAVRFSKTIKGKQISYDCFSLAELAYLFDTVFCVSNWQKYELTNKLRFPADKAFVIGNGLQPELFPSPSETELRKPILFYSLPPDRGLLPLLEIFLKVREKIPEAELHAYTGTTIYGESPEDDRKDNEAIYSLARKIPGVSLNAPLPQKELAKKMRMAKIFAYPSLIHETFCISILEAQAAGMVPVVSDAGALPERIRDGENGYILTGDPFSDTFQTAFAERIVNLLLNENMFIKLSKESVITSHSDAYSYNAVAERMLESLENSVSANTSCSRGINLSAADTETIMDYCRKSNLDNYGITPDELFRMASNMKKLLKLI